MKKTLLVMAAGMGSRFGGLKQITPVDEEGNFIIDYSVFDAKRAGFDTVVFVIKKENLKDFEETIGKRLKDKIEVKYAFQDNIKSVLFVSSASGNTGAEFPEYAASKGGVIAYMKNVALRIAKYHATSNSISPGGVITDLNDHILKNENLYEAVLNETLLHRWSDVEEMAKWAFFLTVINKSMTAQDILIDNGEAAKSNFIW